MSRNFGASIALTKLQHVKMTKKGKSGMIEGIFIPIEINDLIKGKQDQDGDFAVYVNTTVFLNDEVNDKNQIGSIKQTQSKKWADMSDEEKEESKKLPYLGNLKEFGTGGNDSNSASTTTFDGDSDDDLPF